MRGTVAPSSNWHVSMKIMVISLPTARIRRAEIARQLDSLDVDFEFFDAIAQREAGSYLHHYEDREFQISWARSAVAGEISCYASHMALWKRCLSENEPYVILEDDADLDNCFSAALAVVKGQINNRGFIRLSSPLPRHSRRIDTSGPFDLLYCLRVPSLATGYAISPHAAGLLIESGSVIGDTVDGYIQRYWSHGQAIFAITPCAVSIARCGEQSQTRPRLATRHGFGLWSASMSQKTANALRGAAFSAKFLAKESGWLRGLHCGTHRIFKTGTLDPHIK